jgi:hypothetical protein
MKENSAHEKLEGKAYEKFEEKMEPKLDIDVTSLLSRFNRLKDNHYSRDNKMAQIKTIREGKMSELAPDVFPEIGWMQEPMIANQIDVAAREFADLIAPLPSFSCVNPTMISERSRENATLKTKVVQAIVYNSDLQNQMYTAADWYISYGFLPFKIEADYESAMPVIRAIDPMGTYTEFDRFGNVVAFFQRILIQRGDLLLQYPEIASKLKSTNILNSNSTDVEVILYHDKHWDIAFLPNSGEHFVLDKSPNTVGKVLVEVAQRPGLAGARGQFDDVIFVQLAKAQFAILQMRAAEDSIKAPLAAPIDVQEIPYGDGAIIKSSRPQDIRRISLEIPQSVLLQGQSLEREFQIGSRAPKTNVSQSLTNVSGRGVEELNSAFDTQNTVHKSVFARTFQKLVSKALEVDEKIFAGIKKTLNVSANGTPVEVTYTPDKVIKGDYSVDVKYGLDLGMDPNRWLVFALQARADKMFSRDFMRRNFPMDIDVEEEAIKTDVENMEEALLQSLMGWAQSIPVLAGQGQDPSAPVLALTNAIDARKKGVSVADAVKAVMLPTGPTPEEIAAQQAQEAAMQAQMAGGMEGMPMEGGAPGEAPMGGEGVPEGLNVLGLMRGTAPGQQGMAPGGRPDLATLMAGLTSRGEPNLQANITRNVAI